MFSFDKTDFQRLAISTLGALAVSTACVMAAVGPAHAGVPVPLTVADWQANVEKQIDVGMHHAIALPNIDGGEAVVAVRFDGDGKFAGARLIHSTGVSTFDEHAVKLARRVAYPVLPAGYRGQPQQVEMHLSYADEPAVRVANQQPKLAFRAIDGMQVASK